MDILSENIHNKGKIYKIKEYKRGKMKEISSLKEIISDREITIEKLNEQIKEIEKEHNYTYEEEFEF